VLDHDISNLEKEVGKLRSKASIIQDQIKELQAKILEIGGVKLRAMQSKVANTKGMIDLAGDNIVKAEVAQAKAQRDAEKLEKTIASNTAVLEQLQSECEVVEADLASCQADLETITAKVQEAQDGMEDVHETLAEAKQELDEKLSYINAFRSLQVRFKTLTFHDLVLTLCQRLPDGYQAEAGRQCANSERKQEQAQILAGSTRRAGTHPNRVRIVLTGSGLMYLPTMRIRSEEDEDDEEEGSKEPAEDTAAKPEEGDSAAAEGEAVEPKKVIAKAEPTELVEYSPDELQGVNKDILNAEITQLEGQ
jgi:structural maintenance of chromosome 4